MGMEDSTRNLIKELKSTIRIIIIRTMMTIIATFAVLTIIIETTLV